MITRFSNIFYKTVKTWLVTELKDNANYDIVIKRSFWRNPQRGVLSDEIIELEVKEGVQIKS
jgi:hypothetical protein